jgi:hypothetical protein
MMITSTQTAPQTPEAFQDQAVQFLLTWTPRLLVVAFAGYYGLGFAYEMGIMAEIDKIAIPIIKSWVGYAGLGAAMPTFQWYSAWGVRMAIAACAGIVYDLSERITLFFINTFKSACCPAPQASSLVRV